MRSDAADPLIGCLLESAAGRVSAHQLPDADLPTPLVRAVVTADLAGLERALVDRRALGRVPTGPVLSGRVDELELVRVPSATGAAWLVLSDPLDDLCLVEHLAKRAESTLGAAQAPAPLQWCLDGDPDAVLPPSLTASQQWWVAAIAGGPAGPVAAPSSQLVVETCVRGPVTYAVVGGRASARSGQVRALVERLVRAGDRRAGLSTACAAGDLPGARRQADLALEIAAAGELVAVDERRSELVVRNLAKGLATLPDLGDDPLARLAEYDARRDGRLVDTLRCWLGSSTRSLAIHGNTLRYRLRRIEQITGIDLRNDPMGRLELQLRLAAQPQLSRSRSSTGS